METLTQEEQEYSNFMLDIGAVLPVPLPDTRDKEKEIGGNEPGWDPIRDHMHKTLVKRAVYRLNRFSKYL